MFVSEKKYCFLNMAFDFQKKTEPYKPVPVFLSRRDFIERMKDELKYVLLEI